ncbi:ABC transporter ATP-binding protein [Paraclostridium bifermentans]|uniref:ABC transporter ATP-binding protein n=1 Tax=Paraclostridium bifermentans TaxID=1490 RepID=UPI0003F985D0|nr:ABC transporter ATP-binding protein [Paraclostridium bifermentans]
MSILKTTKLEKIYNAKIPFVALKDININIEKGEFVAIMGPSGSGKSTFLNVVSTIDSPSSGTVLINGKNPHAMSDQELAHFRRTTLGFVFQSFNLVNTLTVEENIMLPLTLEGVSAKEMKQRVAETSKQLGIESLLNKRVYEISGGQAQRVAVARAVIQNPALLLADEPTGNLDSKSAKDVMEIFNMLNKNNDSTILMVTHDSFVASYCKKVYIIKDGSIYQRIDSSGNRVQFQQKIIDAMTLLGGTNRDLI